MKVKSLISALWGIVVIVSSCSDTEFDAPQGQQGSTSGLVEVYADKSGSEESLLAGNILVQDSRTLELNVPAHVDKVYMKYSTLSGEKSMKEFNLFSATRSGESAGDFGYKTSRKASVKLWLPEDAVQPTDETDGGYLFYHNTGVVMFEDGWPTQPASWYDEDFNDVVFEYDLKVTECQSEEEMAIRGSKEELLLTLDVRAIGGRYPTKLGVVLENLDNQYIDRITAKLLLKGGQGIMRDLAKKELSTDSKVEINARDWRWDSDAADAKRYAALTVDTEPAEGTVITLDGLNDLKDNNQDFFQVTPGKVREGLPMLRAEIRLIGKEGLTGVEREKQLSAYRNLILDTQSQNFFIVTHDNWEIHMRGYQPTSAYQEKYDELVSKDANLDDLYSNDKGYTWGIKVPVGMRHAYEHVPFKEAYTKFLNWVESDGVSNKDWYLHFDPEKTVRYW